MAELPHGVGKQMVAEKVRGRRNARAGEPACSSHTAQHRPPPLLPSPRRTGAPVVGTLGGLRSQDGAGTECVLLIHNTF